MIYGVAVARPELSGFLGNSTTTELIILLVVSAALRLIALLVRLVNMTRERVVGGERPSS